ncbi:MAG: 2-C-methyl-D-erythritol 4-phosphate cytidylyltransferase [Bacillota bacterium]
MNWQDAVPDKPRPRTIALVVAAGAGSRMGGVKKQFLPIGGVPVVVHSIRPFQALEQVDAVVLVVPAGDIRLGRALVPTYGLSKVKAVVEGGERRWDSVKSGLDAARAFEPGIILVHDGARPLVTTGLVERVLQAAASYGAAVPAVEIHDTVKTVYAGSVESSVDRDRLRAIQTPQGFWAAWLFEAYERPAPAGATDDAWLVEACGHPVQVVEGARDNFKLTREDDLIMAERLLSNPVPAVGIGYDVHRLEADRPFILGGVEIPADLGLAGHSDADVLVHAIIDALLGAAGLPDIGQHFPNTDPAFQGAASTSLLNTTVERVLRAGFRILNVDATVVCENPRLAPHIPMMKEVLAPILRISAGRIGIKATTQEGMGFVGRAEGVCAWCVALLESRLD